MKNYSAKNYSRKQAIEIGVFSLLMLGGGIACTQVDPAEARLRPPGAPATEDDFLKLCYRCQKCTMVCETGVIETLSAVEGPRAASTPILNFDESWCNFCGKCYEVCPTGALVPSGTDKPPIIGVARINKDHCVAWDWTGCTVCSDVCPEEAIILDDQERPSVDEDACNGCGLCQLECPNAALRSFDREFASVKGIIVEPLMNQ